MLPFHSAGTVQQGRRHGGMGGRFRRESPDQDTESLVEISLAEAYQGTTWPLELSEPGGGVRRLEVKISVGVSDGARIRIAGQGLKEGLRDWR